MESQYVTHEGREWQRDPDGRITWWDDDAETWTEWSKEMPFSPPDESRFLIAYQLSQQRRRPGAGALIAAIGGTLLIVGALLPWITVRTGFGSVSISGVDEGGDGIFMIVIGVLTLAVSGGDLLNLELPNFSRVLVLILGFVAGVILLIDYSNISERIGGADNAFVSAGLGAGFIVCAIGAVITFLGGAYMTQSET